MQCKSSNEVVKHAEKFLNCISKITHPSEIHFSAYTDQEPIERLCLNALEVAKGGEDTASASLTIASGDANTFQVKGTHAFGTIFDASSHAKRLWLMIIASVIVIIAFLVLKCR